MTTLERYAEEKRSGKSTEGEAGKTFNEVAKELDDYLTKITEAPDLDLPNVERRSKSTWLWMANFLLSAIIIGLLVYMIKFMDHGDVAKLQQFFKSIPTTSAQWKTAFVNWANTDGNILQVDCKTRTQIGKNSEKLTGCGFVFLDKSDDATSNVVIKPL